MYGEKGGVRPRKVHGGWGQSSGFSTSVYRVGDSKDHIAVALPIESYHPDKPAPKLRPTPKNISKAIFHHFEHYCEKSTLHGLRYVGDTSLTIVERLFWIVAFCSAFAFACYYILQIFDKWNNNPVIVAFNPTDANVNDIPFPAITICNMNQVKRSEAEKILQEQNPVELQLLEDYCNLNTSYGDSNEAPKWDVLQNFLIRAGQTCSDTLKTCTWHGERISCEEFFNNDLTDEGLCCSFNRMPAEKIFRNPKDLSFLNHTFPRKIYDWSPEKGFDSPNTGSLDTTPLRPVGSGTHLGLTIVVDAQLDNYYCSSTNSAGFKIILYNPIETPKIADFGFLVNPGIEARYSIKPEIKEATKSLKNVAVEKRQCFFQDERPLKYYRSYTARNCRQECQSNHTYSKCKCIPYYLPKSHSIKICGKRDDRCTNEAKEDMELVYGNGSSCNCLPSCYEMDYEKSTTSSGLVTMNFRHRWDNISDEYFIKNMAILHFYFNENRFRRQIKSEIYGFTEVLSNVGGLLGLCLGFSILSLIEIVYFVTLKLLCGYLHVRKRRMKRKEKNSVIPFTS